MSNQFAEYGASTSAGSGAWTATPRDLYSAPRPASPVVGDGPALEWDTYPQTAGKDEELSRGFGGSAPDFSALGAAGIAAEGAGFPSLDSLKNNRHSAAIPAYYQRPVGRGKFCGRLSVKGLDPKTGRMVYRRINCGSWSCSYCGPRKARTARAAIRTTAEGLGLRYFLTLTLDPKLVPDKKQQVAHMRLCFNKFREYLKRRYGVAPSYISVVEFTQAGVPHLHCLFDRFIPQAWISSVWDRLGGGRIVFIKQVTVLNVARYLSKYLTKELLLSAPKGTRRITTARSIKLFPKFDSGISWELIRESIWRALEKCRMRDFSERQGDLFRFIGMHFDEEKFLNAFEMIADG